MAWYDQPQSTSETPWWDEYNKFRPKRVLTKEQQKAIEKDQHQKDKNDAIIAKTNATFGGGGIAPGPDRFITGVSITPPNPIKSAPIAAKIPSIDVGLDALGHSNIKANVKPTDPWYKRATGNALNAFLQPFNTTVNALGDIFDTAFSLDREQLLALRTQIALETNQSIPPLPADAQKRIEMGLPAFPTDPAETIAAGVNLVTGVVGAYFSPISASLGAAQELPIVGKFPFGVINKGFELLDSASRPITHKAVGMLPISNDAKAVLYGPLENLAATVATLAVIHGIHTVAKTGGGKLVESLPVSEKTQVNIKKGVSVGASFSLDPFGSAYKTLVGTLSTYATNVKGTKGDITVQDAKEIVNKTAKEVPIPEDKGVMSVPTAEGDVKVYTNQRTVLQNFIKGSENIDYKQVKTLGNDVNGNPIQSRFEWDFKTKRGTIYTTNKTTAANLAHELGHYFDRTLAASVDSRLSDLLPDYTQNRDELQNTLTSYAVDKLGGDATSEQISAFIEKTVAQLREDIKVAAAGERRQSYSEQFASAFGNVINDPNARAQAPTLADFVDSITQGKITKQGGKPDLTGQPGTTQEAQSAFGALKKAKTAAIKDTIANNPKFQEQRIANETAKASVEAQGQSVSANFDWQNTVKAIRNSSEFKKEGSITDKTVNGVIMEKDGKYRLVPTAEANKMVLKGWTIRATMDEVAHANGFETAEDYATFVQELDLKSRAISRSPEKKAAHEFLLKNDPNYAKLYEQINTLRDQITKEAATVLAEKQTGTGNAGQVPSEQKSGGEVAAGTDAKLLEEAKKYKTAEEFVDSVLSTTDARKRMKTPMLLDQPDNAIKWLSHQTGVDYAYYGGLPDTITVYRAVPNANPSYLSSDTLNPFDYVSANKKFVDSFMDTGKYKSVIQQDVPVKDLAFDDGGMYENGLIYRPSNIKNYKQYLTDIWNMAHETTTPPQAGPTDQGTPPPAQEPSKIAGTGLDTGKRVKDRLSYNPDKINAPKDVEDLFKEVSSISGEFKNQRISKTDEGIKALANEIGITPEQLIGTQPGSIANAETVFRARQLAADLAQDLRDYVRTIDTTTATPEQLKTAKDKLLRLQGTMKTIAGFRTEASNVFRQFNIEAKAGENDIMRGLLEDLKKADIAAGEDLTNYNKKVREIVEPTRMDKAWHLWYASVLSGGSTQIKNVLGNTSQLVMEAANNIMINPSSTPDMIQGLFDGFRVGYKQAKGILKEGERNKFEERGIKPIVFEGKLKFLNLADYVGRSLGAADALAREGYRGLEARALAFEQAKKEGFTGDELKQRTQEIYDNQPDTMKAQADAFAQRGTYTEKPEGIIGLISSTIANATHERTSDTIAQKGARSVIRFFVPFTRVVANVFNHGLDWTPVGFGREALKLEDVKKGDRTTRQQRQALGRAALGTMAMMYFASLASKGMLSGNGPSNKSEREALEALGWQRNSIKIGDAWYPYQNWGPLAVGMTLVGNYFDSVRYGELDQKNALRSASAAMLGSVDSLLSMSFLQGVADLFDSVSSRDPKWLERFIAQQVTTPVPNLVKQTARYFDPTIYTVDNLQEQIQSNLRISKYVGQKPDLNVWGEARKGTALTQLQPTFATKDPVKQYLAEQNIWIPLPGKTTKLKIGPHESRQMTQDEYYEYVKRSGPMIHDAIERKLDYIKRIPDDANRKDYIDKIVQDVRDQVKNDLAREAR